MTPLTINDIIKATHAKLLGAAPPPTVAEISTDSRNCVPGALFFALRGDRFDGHDYLDGAFDNGAAAALISRQTQAPRDRCYLRVNDTTMALGELAAYYRRQLSSTVVAITGSNGKTTTKELTAHLLRRLGSVCKAEKSFNNHLGVPLTLLATDMSDASVVVEIGSNHPGEVSRLAQMVAPDIGVITSVGCSHLGNFGSEAAIASEKLSLFTHTRPGGIGIYNADTARLAPCSQMSDLRMVSFAINSAADICAENVECHGNHLRFSLNGRIDITLPLIGRHNVYNALAAIAVALCSGMTVEDLKGAFDDFAPPPMRLNVKSASGMTLIDDCYNANPSSMTAALEVLVDHPVEGRRVFICGDMLELGEHDTRCHYSLGLAIARAEIGHVIAVGQRGEYLLEGIMDAGKSGQRVDLFASSEQAAAAVEELLAPGDVVLVKGSRSVALEKVTAAILNNNS